MPTIEERALALVNEVAGFDYLVAGDVMDDDRDYMLKALCRAIETLDAERAAHAQFRQEVSDVVNGFERYCTVTDTPFPADLFRFILPKPVDPLVEVFREVRKHHAKEGEEWAEAVVRRAHDAAAELGYKLKLVEVGDADV